MADRNDLIRAVMSLIVLLGIGDEIYEILNRKRQARLLRVETKVGFM